MPFTKFLRLENKKKPEEPNQDCKVDANDLPSKLSQNSSFWMRKLSRGIIMRGEGLFSEPLWCTHIHVCASVLKEWHAISFNIHHLD